jgi:rod shape-determining protein MreD
MIEYIKFGVVLVVLILIQKSLIWLIAVTEYQITPDIILIGIVYLGIKKGKIPGSIGGFTAGLIFDLFSFSFLGLSALSKATSGFISGFFNRENKVDKYTETYIFILIVFISSLFNNILYFSLYFQGTSLNFTAIIIRYIFPSAIYTALLAIPLVIFNKRRSSKR